MTFGSLFAGIGGFDLGFERAGLRCEWQVEIDPYCQKVLAKHWPHVKRWDDVRTFPPEGNWNVDVICGGFPCQDISQAGRGVGIGGERSGLWFEFARIIRILRPRFVAVENVSALLFRGMDRVLGELAESGYDAEWQSISAAAFGAPHIRERVFILAYPNADKQPASSKHDEAQGLPESGGHVSYAASQRQRQLWREQCTEISQGQWDLYWARRESPVPRVADGVPNRVDRLTALGNSIVPQVAEWIGRRLMAQV